MLVAFVLLGKRAFVIIGANRLSSFHDFGGGFSRRQVMRVTGEKGGVSVFADK